MHLRKSSKHVRVFKLFIFPFSYLMQQVSSLDVWLPLLVSSSVQVSISIAWILASCVRYQHHRDAVTQWLPPADRSKETKGKRGWERPDVGNSNAPGRGGGWLVRNITELYRRKDFKVVIYHYSHQDDPYFLGTRSGPLGFGGCYQGHSSCRISAQTISHR